MELSRTFTSVCVPRFESHSDLSWHRYWDFSPYLITWVFPSTIFLCRVFLPDNWISVWSTKELLKQQLYPERLSLKIWRHASKLVNYAIRGAFSRLLLESCFWRHILDQKQDGIATRKRKCNQKIVFSLRRVQALTFLKIYGEIHILAK